MRWEELSSDRFAEAVKECEGVCLVALSVIERHGHHLPLGTDMYEGRGLLSRVAELEPVIVATLSQSRKSHRDVVDRGIEGQHVFENICNVIYG